MYYRTSDARGQQRRDILSRIICTDGCSWSAPVTVLEDATGRLLLSPAVQVIGEMFYLWTVEAAPDARHLSIVRRCSHDGCSWSGPRPVTLVWLDATLAEPWHVDVVRHDDLLILVGSAREPSRQGTQRFFSAVGDVNDLGLRWHPQRPLSATRYMFEAGKPYRASYLPPGRDSEMGRLYTSSTDRHGMWWTACRPWLFRMDAR